MLDVLRRKELFRYYGTDAAKPPPMAAQLEKEFRTYIGTDYALAVTSGSAALEVALAAAGDRAGRRGHRQRVELDFLFHRHCARRGAAGAGGN